MLRNVLIYTLSHGIRAPIIINHKKIRRHFSRSSFGIVVSHFADILFGIVDERSEMCEN